MDRQEAQHILQLCRPDNIEDRNDPLIAEALERLSEDAELNTWFEEQQALDTEISAKFDRIEPPADLKASILVGMRAHAAHAAQATAATAAQTEASSNVLPFEAAPSSAPASTQPSFWRKAALGVAALVAVMFIAKTIPTETQNQIANNGTENQIATAGVPSLINFLSNEIKEFKKTAPFEKKGPQYQELQQYLSEAGMPTPGELPDSLEGLPSLGCVTFRYNDCAVSMICFKQDGAIYHLLTTDSSTCAKTYAQQPAIYEHNEQSFQTWAADDQIYILSVAGSQQNLPIASK
ncbi:MAG: hypothetical protein ACI8Z5_001863 [Lentimonas sp.]|jgi:hypothetical protein